MDKSISEARQVLLSASHGVLSTHSLAVPGYPFGSIVPYCIDRSGMPIILIADMALHTKNINVDNKVSLTITETKDGNVQEHGRLTLVGNCEKVSDSDKSASVKYRAYFPASASYFDAHNFHYYRINSVKVRYIGGFGKIHWLEPDELVLENPLSEESETRTIEHMNDDHKMELVNYCSYYKNVDVENPVMIGIDGEGFDLLADNNKIRFLFDTLVTTALEAKEILVAMAKESKT